MPRKKPDRTLERRGNGYRVRFQLGKERHSITVATTDRRAVGALIEKRIAELRASAERRIACVRLSELFDRFERDELPKLAPGSRATYEDALALFRSYWVNDHKDPPIDSVQPGHIDAFMAWRREHRLDECTEPLSGYSLRKEFAILHRIFSRAERWNLFGRNPAARAERPRPDKRDPIILSDADVEKLLKACGDRPFLRLFTLLLIETGLRCESEALWLTWDDVKLDDRFLWVAQRDGHRTKSGQGRWVPMTEKLTAAMREHFATYRFSTYDDKATPWIFHHDHTSRTYKAGERIQSLRGGFRNAAKRAKLPDAFRPHDLRHRRVTTWLAEGKSATLVKEAVGHADLRTTMLYTHLSKEHLRALVDQPPTVPVARHAASA